MCTTIEGKDAQFAIRQTLYLPRDTRKRQRAEARTMVHDRDRAIPF